MRILILISLLLSFSLSAAVPSLLSLCPSTVGQIVFKRSSIKRENLHGFIRKGALNDGIYTAKLDGVDVVIKAIDLKNYETQEVDERRSRMLKSEILMYKELSDKGYAPKFYGVTDLGNGVYGIVAKQIFPSILIKNHLKMQNHVRYATVESLLEARKASDEVKRKWAKRMREMALYLDRQKIRGLDLQYLLVPNGDVFMIDFGNFYRAEVKDLYRQTVTDTEDMIESFESEGPIS